MTGTAKDKGEQDMSDFIKYRGWYIARDLSAAYRAGRLTTMYFYGESLSEIKQSIDRYYC